MVQKSELWNITRNSVQRNSGGNLQNFVLKLSRNYVMKIRQTKFRSSGIHFRVLETLPLMAFVNHSNGILFLAENRYGVFTELAGIRDSVI